jgi:CBS-domain-containing membrane protein
LEKTIPVANHVKNYPWSAWLRVWMLSSFAQVLAYSWSSSILGRLRSLISLDSTLASCPTWASTLQVRYWHLRLVCCLCIFVTTFVCLPNLLLVVCEWLVIMLVICVSYIHIWSLPSSNLCARDNLICGSGIHSIVYVMVFDMLKTMTMHWSNC